MGQRCTWVVQGRAAALPAPAAGLCCGRRTVRAGSQGAASSEVKLLHPPPPALHAMPLCPRHETHSAPAPCPPPQFTWPYGVAVSSDGNTLFVSDASSCLITKFVGPSPP